MVTPRTKRGGQVFIGAVGLWSNVEQRGVTRCLYEQWVCGLHVEQRGAARCL